MRYVEGSPSAQNALDVFRGEWVSRLPGELGGLRAGELALFEDDRIDWLLEEIGGVAGKRVLELGPLEGGHTYMLDRAGASRVVAIEANTHAFLKCLVVKELVGLPHSVFLCGDLVEYLRSATERFDVCVASGVLYHMRDPLELLSLLGGVADTLFLWTHYYDQSVVDASAALGAKFTARTTRQDGNVPVTLHRYEYGSVRGSEAFCGGSAEFSYWLERETILRTLERLGLGKLRIGFDAPDHPNGPSFAIVAERV